MNQMHISTNQVSSVVLRPKKLEIPKTHCENCKRAGEKTHKKYCAMNYNTHSLYVHLYSLMDSLINTSLGPAMERSAIVHHRSFKKKIHVVWVIKIPC
jgi:hypothetical protein